MNKRLLLCAMIVPGALAVSPMVSAQAKESVSLKEYQQAKASQAVSLNEAMVMAFENSPFDLNATLGIDHKVCAAGRNGSCLCDRNSRNRQSQAQIFLTHGLSYLFSLLVCVEEPMKVYLANITEWLHGVFASKEGGASGA